MHAKLLYTYLTVTTIGEGVSLYLEMQAALSIFLIITAAQWMIVPLLCQCAKRVGINAATDEAYCEAIDVYVAELRGYDHVSMPQDRQ